MKKLLVGLLLVGCTDEEASRRALDAAGYTDIYVGGYSFTGCSKDDTYSTEFTARNIRGQSVSGVVCCGIFKNCTVRFE